MMFCSQYLTYADHGDPEKGYHQFVELRSQDVVREVVGVHPMWTDGKFLPILVDMTEVGLKSRFLIRDEPSRNVAVPEIVATNDMIVSFVERRKELHSKLADLSRGQLHCLV